MLTKKFTINYSCEGNSNCTLIDIISYYDYALRSFKVQKYLNNWIIGKKFTKEKINSGELVLEIKNNLITSYFNGKLQTQDTTVIKDIRYIIVGSKADFTGIFIGTIFSVNINE